MAPVDEFVIMVCGVRKHYAAAEAVAGIDFEVRRGEVFAFLGPNGAGQTTRVEILEGIPPRSEAEARVLGVDPEHARVGVAHPECSCAVHVPFVAHSPKPYSIVRCPCALA
jgi:ABC-type multidrug transport system ATPase subunit